MSLTFWVVLRRFKQSRKQERTAHALQKVSSDDREAVECGFEHERGGGWDLHNSHSSQYSPYPAGGNTSMLHLCIDWKAPWQLPGSGVTQKGCFYPLMRSVPGAPRLPASVSLPLLCVVKDGGFGSYECLPSDTNAIFTRLRPDLWGVHFEPGMGQEGLLVLGTAP